MPLKLGTISQEIDALVENFSAEENLQKRDAARSLLHTLDPAALRDKIRNRTVRVPWLVGVPVDSLDGHFPAPTLPSAFSVAAADGSSIYPDRHIALRYYLFNTSQVILTYGQRAEAHISSSSRLYYRNEEIYLAVGRRSKPIEGALLEAKRSIAETRALWDAARQAPSPTVAFLDGSMILWNGLQNEERETREEILGEFLNLLGAFRQARIPIAGYISYPGSHDVSNALRVWLCQWTDFRCEECSCPERDLSLALLRIWDQELFRDLAPGERSAVFDSESQILRDYGEHRVQFFYLNVDGEIARLEAPRWVTEDESLLNLLHAVVYDQCQRSGGYPPYPPALQEAHEEAVITQEERGIVEGLIEDALARKGIPYFRSAKSQSKRVRAV